jgi:hypothetical protein
MPYNTSYKSKTTMTGSSYAPYTGTARPTQQEENVPMWKRLSVVENVKAQRQAQEEQESNRILQQQQQQEAAQIQQEAKRFASTYDETAYERDTNEGVIDFLKFADQNPEAAPQQLANAFNKKGQEYVTEAYFDDNGNLILKKHKAEKVIPSWKLDIIRQKASEFSKVKQKQAQETAQTRKKEQERYAKEKLEIIKGGGKRVAKGQKTKPKGYEEYTDTQGQVWLIPDKNVQEFAEKEEERKYKEGLAAKEAEKEKGKKEEIKRKEREKEFAKWKKEEDDLQVEYKNASQSYSRAIRLKKKAEDKLASLEEDLAQLQSDYAEADKTNKPAIQSRINSKLRAIGREETRVAQYEEDELEAADKMTTSEQKISQVQERSYAKYGMGEEFGKPKRMPQQMQEPKTQVAEGGTEDDPIKVRSKDEYDKLPPGTWVMFKYRDGNWYVKQKPDPNQKQAKK